MVCARSVDMVTLDQNRQNGSRLHISWPLKRDSPRNSLTDTDTHKHIQHHEKTTATCHNMSTHLRRHTKESTPRNLLGIFRTSFDSAFTKKQSTTLRVVQTQFPEAGQVAGCTTSVVVSRHCTRLHQIYIEKLLESWETFSLQFQVASFI